MESLIPYTAPGFAWELSDATPAEAAREVGRSIRRAVAADGAGSLDDLPTDLQAAAALPDLSPQALASLAAAIGALRQLQAAGIALADAHERRR